MHLSITLAASALAFVVHASRVVAHPYNATADAAIHLFTFDGAACHDNTQGSPFEMKNDQCVNLPNVRSAEPALWVGHSDDWIDEINNLHTHCKLELFGQEQCMSYSRITSYQHANTEQQPENFNRCLIPTGAAGESGSSKEQMLIKSAKFSCVPVENPEHVLTRTLQLTHWSVEPTYHSAVSRIHKATLTCTLQAPTPPAKVLVKRDATDEAVQVLSKRGNQPGKGVWMLHPWDLSWICYSCYLKQADKNGKMECRSGVDYPIDCGPMPGPFFEGPTTHHTSTTSTKTVVSTTHSTSTTTTTAYVVHKPDFSGSDIEFIHLSRKRSWHTPVKFSHPFQVGKEACADAEWQKRGQYNTYIEIQHVHICDHNDNPDSKWIGLPPTVIHTLTATKAFSRVIGHAATSTSTYTATHDQL